MTYKEFKEFCNERATDGCWSMEDAFLCIKTLEIMHKTPFWKKKEVWAEFEPITNTFYVEWLELMKARKEE